MEWQGAGAMKTVNRVILVGQTGSEAHVQERADGTVVAACSLSTRREGSERTDWHRIEASGATAEDMAGVVRGTRLYVEGSLRYGSFDRDGFAIPTVDVVVEAFVVLK